MSYANVDNVELTESADVRSTVKLATEDRRPASGSNDDICDLMAVQWVL